jgi:hypothetical protein
MTEGYVSDIDGDDTVMDTPTVTVSINIANLPPAQALAIEQEAGDSDLTDVQRGQLMDGERLDTDYGNVRFHLPLGPALTALASINAVDVTADAPDDPSDVVDQQG